jgi:AcrR family transcriptional regulator
LRSIASEAGVDPALLIHYFKTKKGLFLAAMGLPAPHLVPSGGLGSLSRREAADLLVRRYLAAVDSDEGRNAILALVRSAASNEQAATLLREFYTNEVLRSVRELAGNDDKEMKATIVASQLIGIAVLRHIVRVDRLARAIPEEVVAAVAPVIELCLR